MVLAHCGWCSLIIVAKRREPQDVISSDRAVDVCPLLSSALNACNVRGHPGTWHRRAWKAAVATWPSHCKSARAITRACWKGLHQLCFRALRLPCKEWNFYCNLHTTGSACAFGEQCSKIPGSEMHLRVLCFLKTSPGPGGNGAAGKVLAMHA